MILYPPLRWVPTLYFAMGLPFVVLNMVSAVLFKDLGISDAQIAFWTSLIMWPWTIKFLWSPFLEIFRTKKYKVPRGRRPRLTADQKAANNISRRLRSVLFATQQHLEIPATGSGARASVSAKSVAIFRPGTRFATFGLVVPGKIVTFESYLFKPIERCSNACSRLRPSSIKRG